ncbi:MAG: hypothetical protein SW019_19310 [Actinomycetota bacterium]|nr:hypothetical protein [Actinomycetota bacterium]
MKKFGSMGILATALTAAVIGLAGPAQADDDENGFGGPGHGYYYGDSNNPWLGQLVPTVKVPHVDTTVRN